MNQMNVIQTCQFVLFLRERHGILLEHGFSKNQNRIVLCCAVRCKGCGFIFILRCKNKEKQKMRPMSALPQNHRAFGQRAVTSAAQEDMECNIKLKPPAASLRAASAMCCRWQARLWALATSGVFPIWQPNTAAAFFFWFIWCSCSPLALH